jgi:hypothetical protein
MIYLCLFGCFICAVLLRVLNDRVDFLGQRVFDLEQTLANAPEAKESK